MHGKYAQENAQGTYGVTDEERVRGNPQRVSGNMVGRTKKGTRGKTHGVAYNGKQGERKGALFTRMGEHTHKCTGKAWCNVLANA